MKRFGRCVLVLAAVVVAGACAGPVAGGGGGSGYSVESLCKAACDCFTADLSPDKADVYCSDEALEGCVEDFENSRDYADGLGCGDEFEDYADCLDANASCDDDGNLTSAACDADGEAYAKCIAVATGACAFTDDDQCDEPQGTGLCDPGTDTNDCQGGAGGSGGGSSSTTTTTTSSAAATTTSSAAATTSAATTSVTTSASTTSSGGGGSCDNTGNCGDSVSGCIGCSLQGNCTDEYDTCAASIECIDFSTCAGSCADQACYDQCVNAYPTGSSLYNDLLVCILCNECYNDCDGAASGCP